VNSGLVPGAGEPGELSCSLTAYRLPRCANYLKIVPASVNRAWMDVDTGGWANRWAVPEKCVGPKN
jgi:hypothetical protein